MLLKDRFAMREIPVSLVTNTVKRLCVKACCELPPSLISALEKAIVNEQSESGRDVLACLLENAKVAKACSVSSCQDTGMAVVFLDIGQDVHLTEGDLYDAVNQGVRQGYSVGFLRKSVLHPITRENTGDNTPAVIHLRIVPGSLISVTVAPKGFGSENMSALSMLTPSVGQTGIYDFIVDTVRRAGANPCPPILVGVGIGGTFEAVALLAKRQLLRNIGTANDDPQLAAMELELLYRINALGIGPMGLGGTVTALAVHVGMMPTHLAGLPVAVNIQCHAARHVSENI
jgi:fumarate hydratase subunit alpha